jgi:hypothetical protein
MDDYEASFHAEAAEKIAAATGDGMMLEGAE